MKKYLIGSHLLGLKNNHDIDYLNVVESDDATLYKREFIDGEDIVTRSSANISMQMNFELPIDKRTAAYYIINYQLDNDIIAKEFPIEYHVLNKRNQYIKLLNYIVDNNLCNFTRDVVFNGGHLSKTIYHIAYLTFILENNSTTITAEQKAVVQQIHDKQMPIAYLDELESRIRNLK